MISGCEDTQTSADVSDVGTFKLPDPQGRAGGACTSTLLNLLYKDNETPEDEYTFVQVLDMMRTSLKRGGFTQIPQLTSANKLDMNAKFDIVPPEATGKRRALMVGINYTGHDPGELSGCQNDVFNMVRIRMLVLSFGGRSRSVFFWGGEARNFASSKPW
jgi:metacaspase-1